MRQIRPWEGSDGLIRVMRTHLQDYVICEEKYGSSKEEYKYQKIASVKETLVLLERMNDPLEYSNRRRDEVESRYPKYKQLITEYKKGGTCYSGDFVAQEDGWVGKESGNKIRKLGFKNELFQTLEKVVDRLCDTIKSLTTDMIKSITARDWVLSLF